MFVILKANSKPMRCDIGMPANMTLAMPERYVVEIDSLCLLIRHVDKVTVHIDNLDIQYLRWDDIWNTVSI